MDTNDTFHSDQVDAQSPTSALTKPEVFLASDRLIAAKTALWSALLTANSLFGAAAFAVYFAGGRPHDSWVPVTGIASIIGILTPIACLSSVAAEAALREGLERGFDVPWFTHMRPRLWLPLELLSALCLFASASTLMWQVWKAG